MKPSTARTRPRSTNLLQMLLTLAGARDELGGVHPKRNVGLLGSRSDWMSGFRGAFIFGELCGRGTHLSWLLKNGIDIDIDRYWYWVPVPGTCYHIIYHWYFTSIEIQIKFSGWPLPKFGWKILLVITKGLAGNGGVNVVACYSMVTAVLVKKPVMIGKVLSVTTSLCEGIIGCRAELAGLERRSFLDGYTNRN